MTYFQFGGRLRNRLLMHGFSLATPPSPSFVFNPNMPRSFFFSFLNTRHDRAPKFIRSIPPLLVIGIALLASVGTLVALFFQFTYHDIPSFFGSKISLSENFNDSSDGERNLLSPLKLEDIRSYERDLPQHNLSLPFPEGENGRFIRFSNEIWALGLNNQLHNRLLLSHLAFLSNRAYVFNDITFDHDWGHGQWNSLNTFISGPTAGGQFPQILATAQTPRAVHVSFYQTVCPENDGNEHYAKLQGDEVKVELNITDSEEGVDIMEKWAKKLREMPERCVEVVGGSPHIFDFPLFSSKLILSLYPSIATSPVITQFRWSDVVLRAVQRIVPSIVHPNQDSLSSVKQDPDRQAHLSSNPLLSTLAIHLRRGDFSEHCYGLASMGYPYNSWNILPGLPDRYDEPQYQKITIDENPAELTRFLEHCWPTPDQIVKRIKDVTREYHATLSKNDFEPLSVYILTNERNLTWLAELKDTISAIRLQDVLPFTTRDDYAFKRVSTSRDVSLSGEAELLAKQAIDMAIAERAGLFLGNGFSTLTANVNLLRLSREFGPKTCRFL